MPKPQPLSPGQQQQNRHQLLDYLQLELRLLETQLELQEDPELLLQLSRRYPLDHQGRIVYPLPFRLPPVAAGENPFFLPEEENPAAAPQPSGPGLTPGRRPSPSAPSARPRFTPGGPPEASPKKNKFTRS